MIVNHCASAQTDEKDEKGNVNVNLIVQAELLRATIFTEEGVNRCGTSRLRYANSPSHSIVSVLHIATSKTTKLKIFLDYARGHRTFNTVVPIQERNESC